MNLTVNLNVIPLKASNVFNSMWFGLNFCQKAAKQFLLAFAKSPIFIKKSFTLLWSSYIKEENGKTNKSNNRDTIY